MKLKHFLLSLLLILTVFTSSVQASADSAPAAPTEEKQYEPKSMTALMGSFWETTGINAIFDLNDGEKTSEPKGAAYEHEMDWFESSLGRIIMILITFILFYLAIAKNFEPLLLIPIAFGGLLANIPLAGMGGEHGMLGIIYNMGIANEFFPLLIFMGVGAMTDFGPLLANPKTAILGGAAQFGIFGSLIGAVAIGFSLQDASAISIIGGADGPTSIFIANRLAPDMLGAIAVAAYSYMALVPVIQPPIMNLLTTKRERLIRMKAPRIVSQKEKIIFPVIAFLIVGMIAPGAISLLGMLFFGNLLKESTRTERLANTARHSIIDSVTIILGFCVGCSTQAQTFLTTNSILIFGLGAFSFMVATAGGVLFAKFMNLFIKDKINPLVGAAGVSAVPDSARVVHHIGLKNDPTNFLLMHAMAPNVSGVIGSAIGAGVLWVVLSKM